MATVKKSPFSAITSVFTWGTRMGGQLSPVVLTQPENSGYGNEWLLASCLDSTHLPSGYRLDTWQTEVMTVVC